MLDEQVRRVSIPPEEPTPSEPSPTTVPEHSQWALRVRKCGPSSPSSGDAETPFDGITIPPAPPSKASDR